MTAPNIPNLSTLRKGARGGHRGLSGPRTSFLDRDAVIRGTDDDAASSRMSAVEAGYLEDPFARQLTGTNWQRRLPLMNRGTYVRTAALDMVVDTFLSTTDGPKQIISLGAGSDTRYFRLRAEGNHHGLKYHEIDFVENTKTKIARLRTPECLQDVKDRCGLDLSQADESLEGELDSGEYFIHSMDLRKLPDSLEWLDQNRTTLVISECCLIYLPPAEADRALSYFAGQLGSAPLAIVIYEPFRPHDAFGRTMIRNLTTRGIVLETIERYADLETQRKRLEDQGFCARAVDTDYIWQNWIRGEEKERIINLEWMDEVEEFVLLTKHYCIAWGWQRFEDDGLWEKLKSPQ